MQNVKNDVIDFLKQRKAVFFSESDIQVALALWLYNTNHYDNIYTEYFVPTTCLANYCWGKNDRLYIDIVVEKNGLYVPIELKYKTREIKSDSFSRFGEPVAGTLITDQMAYNEGLYKCWKDVRRLELVKQRFANVVGGYAVTVSNVPVYWKGPRHPNASYAPFSMKDKENVSGALKWNDGEKDGFPPIELSGSYQCKWFPTGITADEFNFCILEIK